jgi:hypothetical protein
MHSNHLMIRNGFNFKLFDRLTAPALPILKNKRDASPN